MSCAVLSLVQCWLRGGVLEDIFSCRGCCSWSSLQQPRLLAAGASAAAQQQAARRASTPPSLPLTRPLAVPQAVPQPVRVHHRHAVRQPGQPGRAGGQGACAWPAQGGAQSRLRSPLAGRPPRELACLRLSRERWPPCECSRAALPPLPACPSSFAGLYDLGHRRICGAHRQRGWEPCCHCGVKLLLVSTPARLPRFLSASCPPCCGCTASPCSRPVSLSDATLPRSSPFPRPPLLQQTSCWSSSWRASRRSRPRQAAAAAGAACSRSSLCQLGSAGAAGAAGAALACPSRAARLPACGRPSLPQRLLALH